jgi:hypothetical protein
MVCELRNRDTKAAPGRFDFGVLYRCASPAGLTRGSILFARGFAKMMDCRVTPGNDTCGSKRTGIAFSVWFFSVAIAIGLGDPAAGSACRLLIALAHVTNDTVPIRSSAKE